MGNSSGRQYRHFNDSAGGYGGMMQSPNYAGYGNYGGYGAMNGLPYGYKWAEGEKGFCDDEEPLYIYPKNPPGAGSAEALLASQRPSRNDFLGFVAGLVIPWALFAVVMYLLSFQFHFNNAKACQTVVTLLGIAIVGGSAFNWIFILRKRSKGDYSRDPTWIGFLFFASLLAFVLALSFGQSNYVDNMRPYYETSSMNAYSSVDPSNFIGNQLMDAGRIEFAESAYIDTSKSLGFRNWDTYCVAPITSSTQQGSYDFWAVGTNCCKGTSATDYHCGEFNNPNAHSGLRLMNDKQRSYFRLAIKQAEATYNIDAHHPLLFYWMSDPDTELMEYLDTGTSNAEVSIIVYFAFQLFLTMFAAYIISKMP